MNFSNITTGGYTNIITQNDTLSYTQVVAEYCSHFNSLQSWGILVCLSLIIIEFVFQILAFRTKNKLWKELYDFFDLLTFGILLMYFIVSILVVWGGP